MPEHTGIAIIDTNCFKYLQAPDEQRRVTASLATADFELLPTAINALEAIQNLNQDTRTTVLGVLDALAPGKPLLPWPRDLLQGATDAISGGCHDFLPPIGGLRLRRERITTASCIEAQEWSRKNEETFSKYHDAARRSIQALIRTKPEQAPWDSVPIFLDEFWTTPSQQDTLLQSCWELFGNEGQAPIEEMIAHPVWRMFLDIEGVSVFERVIEHEQPKPAHFWDLRQLLYLTLRPRRILVTDDKPLFRAATAVLDGRHTQAQVLTWDNFRRCL